MPRSTEFASVDGTGLAELVQRKEVEPIELVEAAIERIERLNPVLNAVVTPMFDQARAAAKGELPDGPFKGVPYLLKDLFAAYAGVPLTAASASLRHYVPDRDSELFVRLKRAGLIILGKTNTPEFGAMATTEPRLFGPTHNPWNLERTPGGSSGGSAAAVASGMVPMAHASDAGGSIRIPASCCGVFGFKPTRARNPLGPDSLGDPSISGWWAEHAITRSVRDSAALLDATAGPEIGAPYWAPPPARPFRQEVGTHPGRLRIAFTTKAVTGVPIHSDCVEAVHQAAGLCADLGHGLVEAGPKVDGEIFVQDYGALGAVGNAVLVEGVKLLTGKELNREDFEIPTWAMYEICRRQTALNYVLALTRLQRLARDMARFFADYDVWLTPTLAEPPVPLGTFDSTPENPMVGFLRSVAFTPFTPICNVTGQPAMSVPLYWNAEGLPIGTHFVGRFGDEATLFRLAAQLEAARPWADRRPPVSIWSAKPA